MKPITLCRTELMLLMKLEPRVRRQTKQYKQLQDAATHIFETALSTVYPKYQRKSRVTIGHQSRINTQLKEWIQIQIPLARIFGRDNHYIVDRKMKQGDITWSLSFYHSAWYKTYAELYTALRNKIGEEVSVQEGPYWSTGTFNQVKNLATPHNLINGVELRKLVEIKPVSEEKEILKLLEDIYNARLK